MSHFTGDRIERAINSVHDRLEMNMPTCACCKNPMINDNYELAIVIDQRGNPPKIVDLDEGPREVIQVRAKCARCGNTMLFEG